MSEDNQTFTTQRVYKKTLAKLEQIIAYFPYTREDLFDKLVLALENSLRLQISLDLKEGYMPLPKKQYVLDFSASRFGFVIAESPVTYTDTIDMSATEATQKEHDRKAVEILSEKIDSRRIRIKKVKKK